MRLKNGLGKYETFDKQDVIHEQRIASIDKSSVEQVTESQNEIRHE